MRTDADRKTIDEHFMAQALQLARRAEALGEVPVGCVVVRHGQLVGEGSNLCIHACDPSAHAEIRALRQAGLTLGNYRLVDCELYVTLEPCPMCAGAMVHARVARVIYGASDPKTGAAGSVFDLLDSPHNNHRPEIVSGILGEECSLTLREFFRRRRAER